MIVKVFQVDYGPVVFPASGFPRKNLGVDLCDWLHYFIDWVILILITQSEKKVKDWDLTIVNCDLARLVSDCSYFSQQSGIRALVV